VEAMAVMQQLLWLSIILKLGVSKKVLGVGSRESGWQWKAQWNVEACGIGIGSLSLVGDWESFHNKKQEMQRDILPPSL
jgi:hypothetical protein